MKQFFRIISIVVISLVFCSLACAQISITGEGYDSARTDANTSERVLTPSSVSGGAFQKMFSWTLDGWPYAQPLYISGSPDLLIVATMNDSVYEFNADSTSATGPIWQVSLIPAGEEAVPNTDSDIQSSVVGIMSTPVYDASTGTIYCVSYTENVTSGTKFYRLHALSVTTGAEKFSGPVEIDNAQISPTLNAQRTGLALANGQVYVGWGSFADTGAYIGYATTYSASTLALNATFQVNGAAGAIWQGGMAPAVDSSGSVYFATGNGGTGDCNYGTTFGESALRFTSALGLTLGDWFTSSGCSTMDSGDLDLGSTGPMLINGGADLVVLDKAANLWVLSTASLGHEVASDTQIVEKIAAGGGGFAGQADAWFNNTLYTWGTNDVMKSWTWNGTNFNSTPTLTGSITSVNWYIRGPDIAVSANGTSDGIGWVLMPESASNSAAGILRAIDLSNLSQIWNSDTNASRDAVGTWVKFRAPVVDNGRVFVNSGSGSGAIDVYGLTPQASGSFERSL